MIQIILNMNHTEAMQEILKVVPETEEEFKDTFRTRNSFMVINVFTKQIRKLIRKKDQKVLVICLNKMDEMYKKGDQALRNAIESVFIYSLDSLTFTCDKAYKNLIFEKIPLPLKNAYLHQIYKSGI